jgi:hypothetical protein
MVLLYSVEFKLASAYIVIICDVLVSWLIPFACPDLSDLGFTKLVIHRCPDIVDLGFGRFLVIRFTGSARFSCSWISCFYHQQIIIPILQVGV